MTQITEPQSTRSDWTSSDEQQILNSIERWVEREVRPIARRHDHADEYPLALVEQMKELGLFGATISQDYGGLGLSAGTYSKIVAVIAEAWMAPTGIFNSHLIMAACVERFGTPAQKEYYLPLFARGELRGGIGLTEPNAGTDLQSIRTRAVRDGDDYVINGSKTWISNGLYGSCFALLTKTNPAAEPAHKGMSMFLVERGEGFDVGQKLGKMGYKAIDSAELIFDNYRVSKDKLIGGEEGGGFCACRQRFGTWADQCRRAWSGHRASFTEGFITLFARTAHLR